MPWGRIGIVLVSLGLGLMLGVVVLMMVDGLRIGQVAPLFAAALAGGAGVAIIAGLRMMEQWRA